MPGRDFTGPLGQGPMTGRGRGYCAGSDMPEYFNHAAGPGFGKGCGRRVFGRGRRGGFGAGRRNFAAGATGGTRFGLTQPFETADAEEEKQFLNRRVRNLQSEVEAIQRRLAELEAQSD